MRMLLGGRQGLGLPFGIAPQKSLGSVTPPKWSITAAVELHHHPQTHCHAGWGPNQWAKTIWIRCEHSYNVMSMYMPTTIQPPAAPRRPPGDALQPPPPPAPYSPPCSPYTSALQPLLQSPLQPSSEPPPSCTDPATAPLHRPYTPCTLPAASLSPYSPPSLLAQAPVTSIRVLGWGCGMDCLGCSVLVVQAHAGLDSWVPLVPYMVHTICFWQSPCRALHAPALMNKEYRPSLALLNKEYRPSLGGMCPHQSPCSICTGSSMTLYNSVPKTVVPCSRAYLQLS